MIASKQKWITGHQPSRAEYQEAFSTPFRIFAPDSISVPQGREHCHAFIAGGIYSREGTLVEAGERPGGRLGDYVSSVNPPRAPRPRGERIEGHSLYGGHFMLHYGHFITETMSRFWVEEIDRYDQVVFFPFVFANASTELSSFHRILLNRVGVSDEKIRFLVDGVVFDRITVPEALWKVNEHVHWSASRIYRRLGSAVRPDASPRRSKWIFLSRGRQLRQRHPRRKRIEGIFRRAGFTIVYPEDLGFPEQERLYAGAEILAGFAGSAMHNCVFCESGTLLIEIGDERTPNGFHPMQEMANAVSGVVPVHFPFESAHGEKKRLWKLLRDSIEQAGLRRSMKTV